MQTFSQKTVAVLVTGSFDILHAGHVELFRTLKYSFHTNPFMKYFFIVALDSDDIMRAQKGEPFHGFDDRAWFVRSAFEMIDVEIRSVIFDNRDPTPTLSVIHKTDFDASAAIRSIAKAYDSLIWVKGAEYIDRGVTEAEKLALKDTRASTFFVAHHRHGVHSSSAKKTLHG